MLLEVGDLRGGRRENYHSAIVAPDMFILALKIEWSVSLQLFETISFSLYSETMSLTVLTENSLHYYKHS